MTSSPRRYPPPAPIKPGLAWMGRRLARIVAFGLGSGLLRPAPGTWGTLLAWVLWVVGLAHVGSLGLAVFLTLALVYGAWACGKVGQELGQADHGGMVWDEMVAFWLLLWVVPPDLFAQALAFVLFRVFDITKPRPIAQLDRRFKNGFGVMLDDLLAALYAAVVFWVIAWVAA